MRRRILISMATGSMGIADSGFSCRIAVDVGHLLPAGKHSIPCARVKRAI
jgi:hypothetical protein